MQNLKRNVERAFWATVHVNDVDEDGNKQKGTFRAKFRVGKKDEILDPNRSEETLLDMVLVEVDHIDLTDSDGEELKGKDLLYACKNDLVLAAALLRTYDKEIGKK